MYDVESIIPILAESSKAKEINPHAFSDMKQVGDNIMCCCPFHNDDKPSFGIQTDYPYYYHCFGCGAKGTIEDLLLLYNFRLLDLDNVYDVNSRQFDLFNNEKDGELSSQIPSTKRYPKYLLNRGISINTMKKYEVYYEDGKVCFPVRGVDGEYYGNVYRSVNTKRFWYDKGIPKKEIVYGLYYFYRDRAEEIYITEGMIDALSCYEMGLPAVSVGGCIVTNEQLLEIVRAGVRQINIMLDMDTPGRTGVRQCVERILSNRIPIKVTVVEYDAKDPNELLLKDKTCKSVKVKGVLI